jgi:hypothetical protein
MKPHLAYTILRLGCHVYQPFQNQLSPAECDALLKVELPNRDTGQGDPEG